MTDACKATEIHDWRDVDASGRCSGQSELGARISFCAFMMSENEAKKRMKKMTKEQTPKASKKKKGGASEEFSTRLNVGEESGEKIRRGMR